MPAPRPYFIPTSLDLKQFPSGFQQAVEEIILPAYQELVVRAASSLERAAGTTLCFDTWLELLEQFEIGRALREMLPTKPVAGLGLAMDIPTESYRGALLPGSVSLKRYMRLTARKESIERFLLQLRVARARWGAAIDGPRRARPAAPSLSQAATESPAVETSSTPVVQEVTEHAPENGNNSRRRPR